VLYVGADQQGPKDLNDESTSLLLARIRALRNGQPVQASLL
jgi:hypothetical protein